MLREFQFQNGEVLTGLMIVPLVVMLFIEFIRWRNRTKQKIGDPKLVSELIRGYSFRNSLIKFVLLGLTVIAVILGASNLKKPSGMQQVERKGVDVLIALDVSKSMLAEDIKPNRLEKSKLLVYKLLSKLSGDRVGLILFAGRAYLQMPLTSDHSAATMYVQNASPAVVPTQGTVISEALKLGMSAFNTSERKFKAMVLISDGEDHDASALELAQQVSENGIMVNTVGIGSPTGTPIPDPATGQYKKDPAGNTVISKLNDEQLKQLAATTKGMYVLLEDVDVAADNIMQQLAKIEETALEDASFLNFRYYYQWFIAAALIMLVAESLLPERKFGTA
jgi:Ca-activated chloride channel family protein